MDMEKLKTINNMEAILEKNRKVLSHDNGKSMKFFDCSNDSVFVNIERIQAIINEHTSGGGTSFRNVGNLHYIDFSNRDLRTATFNYNSFEYTSFENSNLRNCDFTMCYGNANFKNADCVNVNFNGSTLDGSNFENANCEGADFQNVSLRNVNFKNANLKGTIFEGIRF